MFLLPLYPQKTIKNYQNSLPTDLKDQCIEMNKKQKIKIKLQQMSIDIFSNKIGFSNKYSVCSLFKSKPQLKKV